MKSVLFLSALDFKRRSIQAIRLTPLAYAQAGWRVRYVVCTDPDHEDYRYEDPCDPPDVEVVRIYKPTWPPWLLKVPVVGKFLSKFRTAAAILKLAWTGRSQLQTSSYDVLYGYEYPGILAGALLRFWSRWRPKTVVSRFQSVAFVNLTLKRHGRVAALLHHWQDFLAYYVPCDTCIMNNDGTGGTTFFGPFVPPMWQK